MARQHPQISRNQFLSDRVNQKPQALKRCCAQNGLLARFAESNRHRGFSSVNSE